MNVNIPPHYTDSPPLNPLNRSEYLAKNKNASTPASPRVRLIKEEEQGRPRLKKTVSFSDVVTIHKIEKIGRIKVNDYSLYTTVLSEIEEMRKLYREAEEWMNQSQPLAAIHSLNRAIKTGKNEKLRDGLKRISSTYAELEKAFEKAISDAYYTKAVTHFGMAESYQEDNDRMRFMNFALDTVKSWSPEEDSSQETLSNYHYLRAVIEYNMKNHEEALKTILKGSKYCDLNDNSYLYTKAVIFKKLGFYTSARLCAEYAQNIGENSDHLQILLAKLQHLAPNYPEQQPAPVLSLRGSTSQQDPKVKIKRKMTPLGLRGSKSYNKNHQPMVEETSKQRGSSHN